MGFSERKLLWLMPVCNGFDLYGNNDSFLFSDNSYIINLY